MHFGLFLLFWIALVVALVLWFHVRTVPRATAGTGAGAAVSRPWRFPTGHAVSPGLGRVDRGAGGAAHRAPR